MATDEIAVAVDVALSGGGTLSLEDPDNGYEIVSIGPGARTWRRDVIEGRYTHGRALMNAVLDVRTMPIVVRVLGTPWTQVRSRAQAMIDAVSERAWLLTVTIEGVADTYLCEPADVALAGGDEWDKFGIMADQQTYVLSIPYDPVEVALP